MYEIGDKTERIVKKFVFGVYQGKTQEQKTLDEYYQG